MIYLPLDQSGSMTPVLTDEQRDAAISAFNKMVTQAPGVEAEWTLGGTDISAALRSARQAIVAPPKTGGTDISAALAEIAANGGAITGIVGGNRIIFTDGD